MIRNERLYSFIQESGMKTESMPTTYKKDTIFSGLETLNYKWIPVR